MTHVYRHEFGFALVFVFSLSVNILAKPRRETPKNVCKIARYYWVYQDGQPKKYDGSTQTETISEKSEHIHDMEFEEEKRNAEVWKSNVLLRILSCNCIRYDTETNDAQPLRRREAKVEGSKEDTESINAEHDRSIWTHKRDSGSQTIAQVHRDNDKDEQVTLNPTQRVNIPSRPKPDEHPLQSFHLRRSLPKPTDQANIARNDNVQQQPQQSGAIPKIQPSPTANLRRGEGSNCRCGSRQLIRTTWDEIPVLKRVYEPVVICRNYPAVTVRNPPKLPLNERTWRMGKLASSSAEPKVVKSVSFEDIGTHAKGNAYRPSPQPPMNEYATPPPLSPLEFGDKPKLKGILRKKVEKRHSVDCAGYDVPLPRAMSTSGMPQANAKLNHRRQPNDMLFMTISGAFQVNFMATLV